MDSKEISEWSSTELVNWLTSNNLRSIAEICKVNSITGYDLFYITDGNLKEDFQISSFHERQNFIKEISQLIYSHLRLTLVVTETNESATLTLDNNKNLKISDLSPYIGKLFSIEPKDIIFKDCFNEEIISPTDSIVNMIILYPFKYKTLLISTNKALKSNNIGVGSNFNDALSYKPKNYSGLENNNFGATEKKKKYYSNPSSTNQRHNSKIADDIMTSINNIKKYGDTKKDMFSTMQSGDAEIERNRDRDDLGFGEPQIGNNYSTQRHSKHQTPNRGRNIYSFNGTGGSSNNPGNNMANYSSKNSKVPNTNYQSYQNALNENNQMSSTPAQKYNKNIYNNASTEGSIKDKDDYANDIIGNSMSSMPLEIRYKSEKRIYRDRKKSKEPLDNTSDFFNASNNLIMSNDGSCDNDDMKFKPSYPAMKYGGSMKMNDNSYIPRNASSNYQLSKETGITNMKSKIIQPHRVYNEDFLDNEYKYNKK